MLVDPRVVSTCWAFLQKKDFTLGVSNLKVFKTQRVKPLRIQVCPKKGINRLTLQSYCGDGIGNIKPTLGKGMDPHGTNISQGPTFQSFEKMVKLPELPSVFT